MWSCGSQEPPSQSSVLRTVPEIIDVTASPDLHQPSFRPSGQSSQSWLTSNLDQGPKQLLAPCVPRNPQLLEFDRNLILMLDH